MDLLTKIAGTDVFMSSFETMVHQPTIKEIAQIGEENFFSAISIFVGSDKDFFIEKQLEQAPEEERGSLEVQLNYTVSCDLDVFYRYMINKPEQLIIQMFCFLIFEDLRKVNWVKASPTKIVLQLTFYDKIEEKDKTYILEKESFEQFKEIISFLFTYETEESKESKLNPTGPMAQKIADKMAAAAARRASLYGSQNKKQEGSVLSQMVSILATSDKLSINEVLNLTFLQVLIQLNRTQLLQQYKTQITLGAFGGLDSDDIVEWQKII